ncbi:MAG: carbon starvation protein A [Candidatus Omnitrophota bacterium]|nr:MAG: carbon starvation protein A [Candidatus Omnitrophota bacterium]
MNSLFIGLLCLFLFYLGYRFYGKFAENIWGIDVNRKTPAVEHPDGVDYVPAKHWSILFGHHFASIAGAGPIIGPVIACASWGWFPPIIWILLGSIFLGGIHDFSALMASIRNDGKSVGDIAESSISYLTKILFSIFLWLSLILVIAVFAAVGGKTLEAKPEVVIPTFGLIVDAIIVGLLLYKWNVNQILSSFIGVLILFILIVIGYHFPISIPDGSRTWTIILLIYAFFASVIPVNILLQPRDYLATFVLFFGLLFGYIGLLITHPTFHTPAFIKFESSKGPLWPMMCVIIACGAISGFHGLVAGGTTSKQITSEKDAKKIGYGGMIAEGILAVLAVIAVSAGLYWTSDNSSLVYPHIMKKEGWIVAFGKGYGEITKPIFGSLGVLIGIMTLKTFVMTTLDSATRITRYIQEEIFLETAKIKIFKNRYFSAAVIIGFATILALGNWKAIWPVFGASNQLVAAIILFVTGCFLINQKKNPLITFIPSIFMFLTTIVALIYECKVFYSQKKLLLGNISVILIILAFFVIIEGVRKIKRLRTGKS